MRPLSFCTVDTKEPSTALLTLNAADKPVHCHSEEQSDEESVFAGPAKESTPRMTMRVSLRQSGERTPEALWLIPSG
jgi:hypothetical protein